MCVYDFGDHANDGNNPDLCVHLRLLMVFHLCIVNTMLNIYMF